MLLGAIDATAHVRTVVEAVAALAEHHLHLTRVVGGLGTDDERFLPRDGQVTTSDGGRTSCKVQRHGGDGKQSARKDQGLPHDPPRG